MPFEEQGYGIPLEDFVVAEVNISGSASVAAMVTSNRPSCERKNLCIDSISHKTIVEEWMAKIEVMNFHFLKFKLDTGVQASLIPVKLFQRLNVSIKRLLRSNVRLVNYLEEKYPFWKNATLNIWSGKWKLFSPKTRDSNLVDLISMYSQCFEGICELLDHTEVGCQEAIASCSSQCCCCSQGTIEARIKQVSNEGIIAKVEKPTEWDNSLVMIHKHDNNLRICLDAVYLNDALMTTFSLVYISADYISSDRCWLLLCFVCVTRIKLHESSTNYRTCITHWGRYKFLRLPYGICSAPEVFHSKFSEVFEVLPGGLMYTDDIIFWGTSKEEYDEHLKAVMERALKNSVRFDKLKCINGFKQVRHMGHIVSARGIHPDAIHMDAIHSMDVPTCKKDVERFLGAITYLSKFLPNIAYAMAPLNVLLRKDVTWHWEHEQEVAFTKLKDLLCTMPVLKYYDVNKPAILSVGASQTGIGAVLLHDRTMVCPKEMLAIVFGAEHFYQYIYNKRVVVETDHKLLVNIFKKHIVDCLARLQRMRLWQQ
ncbi:hypothetical protein PR048_018165 [Dryococelus australis]|uniref:Reverse transcriptase/retrotransposon-derived protein RNase H-like domain-containing protein n=1 Tax=Dryococelus australis TaxID=614101 RepID=A0ABQ9HBM6_9NEOP|nr:hypothetical protein PR048_018165 [Dryococelus australis]